MTILKIIKKNYFILISTFLFIYTVFNLFDGERGLFSYFEKKEIKNQLIVKKTILTKQLNEVEKRIFLLSENVDLDYLEILFREKFFYGKSNEKVYLISDNAN